MTDKCQHTLVFTPSRKSAYCSKCGQVFGEEKQG